MGNATHKLSDFIYTKSFPSSELGDSFITGSDDGNDQNQREIVGLRTVAGETPQLRAKVLIRPVWSKRGTLGVHHLVIPCWRIIQILTLTETGPPQLPSKVLPRSCDLCTSCPLQHFSKWEPGLENI